MEIILVILIVLVAGAALAVARMPRGHRTGKATVDEREPGRN
jgi:hypothetical protein